MLLVLIGGGMPQLASQESREFSFRLQKGQLAEGPGVVRVTQGDTVALHWEAEQDSEIHLHGYDLKLDIPGGEQATLRLRAMASGRFPITLHGGGGHGHKALSYLEVHPR